MVSRMRILQRRLPDMEGARPETVKIKVDLLAFQLKGKVLDGF